MVIPRLILLIIFNWFLVAGAAPSNTPVLKWHRAHFHHVDATLRFSKNQKLSVSCETGSYGTVVEVTEKCYNSCTNEDCRPEDGKRIKEFFTCNQPVVGPYTLRTFSPNPKGVSFTVNKTHFFTSLDTVARDSRRPTLCQDGMKFKIVVTNEVNEEVHRTTMEHPLFSSALSYHTLPASPSTEYTRRTTMKAVETTPMESRLEERMEKPREEAIRVPMLTDKSGMSIEEMENLDRLTSDPPTPFLIRGYRHDTVKLRNHKFDRIGNTVMYNENGEMDRYYEVALPLGIEPSPSSTHSTFISMATVILLLALLL